MRVVFTTKPLPAAAFAALGAFFVVGLMYDMRSLADELGDQHRLMVCMGMYELKTNISDVEYQVTEKGRAASVDNALGLKAKGK